MSVVKIENARNAGPRLKAAARAIDRIEIEVKSLWVTDKINRGEWEWWRAAIHEVRLDLIGFQTMKAQYDFRNERRRRG